MSTFTLAQFNREQWLADQLGLVDFDQGVSTVEERRERIRQEILRKGLAEEIAVRSVKRGDLTFRAAFQRAYDEPLEAAP